MEIKSHPKNTAVEFRKPNNTKSHPILFLHGWFHFSILSLGSTLSITDHFQPQIPLPIPIWFVNGPCFRPRTLSPFSPPHPTSIHVLSRSLPLPVSPEWLKMLVVISPISQTGSFYSSVCFFPSIPITINANLFKWIVFRLARGSALCEQLRYLQLARPREQNQQFILFFRYVFFPPPFLNPHLSLSLSLFHSPHPSPLLRF